MSSKEDMLKTVTGIAGPVAGGVVQGGGGSPSVAYPGTPGFNPNASVPSMGGTGLSGIGNASPLINDGCWGGASGAGLPGSSAGGGGSAFKRPDADSSWFTLEISGGLEMAVYAFEGTEEVSKPFAFSVEVVSTDNAFVLKNVLGLDALLTIQDRGGGVRLVHGFIREAKQLHTSNTYTHYRYEIVPRCYFLGLNQNHRIFQHLSVPEIIKKIFNEQGFTYGTYEFKLRNAYSPREYCTQYGESDLHFISRIAEEEGIYFYFDHKEDKHIMIFSDVAGGPSIPAPVPLRFFAGSGQVADQAVIARLNLNEKINSDTATYRDWNFAQPSLDLLSTKNEPDDIKAPVHGGINYDRYQYPHLYQSREEGERYTEIQLLRQLTWHRWINGETDVSRLTPGFTFTLQEHGRADLNRNWQILCVSHKGEQPQVLQQEAPSGRGMFYNAKFKAIPDDIRFVPQVLHKKNPVIGNQTAIVTGLNGEEIYADQHGRVKVQFFWDREGKWDEKTSCWIRVAQGWAGGQYGAMAIPRIGHEVIVSYLEGNPDRPIITGRVYHGINTPPYELPANKTRTVFKSLSSPGGDGFNELRIEDQKGEEEIYVHAEKDVNTFTKNDWKNHILHDRHDTIDHFTYLETKGETHETFRDQRKTELFANDNIVIHADRHSRIDDSDLSTIGMEFHCEAGQKIVLKAGVELTMEAGGSLIKLDPSGVYINGVKIMINSGGAPGMGTSAMPLHPKGSEGMRIDAEGFVTETGGSGQQRQRSNLAAAASQRTTNCLVCEDA